MGQSNSVSVLLKDSALEIRWLLENLGFLQRNSGSSWKEIIKTGGETARLKQGGAFYAHKCRKANQVHNLTLSVYLIGDNSIKPEANFHSKTKCLGMSVGTICR